jgi:hypothetical protein
MLKRGALLFGRNGDFSDGTDPTTQRNHARCEDGGEKEDCEEKMAHRYVSL